MVALTTLRALRLRREHSLFSYMIVKDNYPVRITLHSSSLCLSLHAERSHSRLLLRVRAEPACGRRWKPDFIVRQPHSSLSLPLSYNPSVRDGVPERLTAAAMLLFLFSQSIPVVGESVHG